MNDDPRCCGSGTCIIDPEGRCWCGQQWDGERMVRPDPMAFHGTPPPGGEGSPAARAAAQAPGRLP